MSVERGSGHPGVLSLRESSLNSQGGADPGFPERPLCLRRSAGSGWVHASRQPGTHLRGSHSWAGCGGQERGGGRTPRGEGLCLSDFTAVRWDHSGGDQSLGLQTQNLCKHRICPRHDFSSQGQGALVASGSTCRSGRQGQAGLRAAPCCSTPPAGHRIPQTALRAGTAGVYLCIPHSAQGRYKLVPGA